MRIILRLFLISYFLCAGDTFASYLNYKNINIIAGLICQNQGLSKFEIDKEMISETEFIIKLNGQCGASFSNKKLKAIGKEIKLQFKSDSLVAYGNLGISTVKIYRNKKGFSKLVIHNPLLNQKDSLFLTSSQWSPNSMIYSHQKAKIKVNGRVIANERSNCVQLNDTRLYNAWNYSSYLCPKELDKFNCEELLQQL